MLSKFNLNKLKEQKWLYFFIGSLFTALLAGGLVYFDVYNVMGLSKLQSDPAQNLPALIADSRAEIYGGLTTNQTGNATSGLIVLGGYNQVLKETYGRVGIGFPGGEIPSEMLEVRGNVMVVDRPETTTTVERLISPVAEISHIINPTLQISDRLRLNSDGLEHLEQRSGTSYYWVYNGNCSCLVARRDQSRLADTRIFSLSPFFQAIKRYLGSLVLPSVWAKGTCFNSQAECIDAGGTYCYDYGDTCPPGQYDFEINCTSNPTADAQCNSGDTPVAGTEDYDSCWGDQYIGKRQCRTTVSTVDWFNKILFNNNQTVIDDDLVADNNKLSNCSWITATECSSGKIMAGYRSGTGQIKCCDL